MRQDQIANMVDGFAASVYGNIKSIEKFSKQNFPASESCDWLRI